MLDSIVIRHCSPARNTRLMRCKTGANAARACVARGRLRADRPPIVRGFTLGGKLICSAEFTYLFDFENKIGVGQGGRIFCIVRLNFSMRFFLCCRRAVRIMRIIGCRVAATSACLLHPPPLVD
ncbi:hypothetical protein DP49_3419 [Burkholderia pseudomallei]|nr:hypothetical protein DP49_3419 [Burkholderia pseudomallei]